MSDILNQLLKSQKEKQSGRGKIANLVKEAAGLTADYMSVTHGGEARYSLAKKELKEKEKSRGQELLDMMIKQQLKTESDKLSNVNKKNLKTFNFVDESGQTQIGTFDPATGSFKTASGQPIDKEITKGYAPRINVNPQTGQLEIYDPIAGSYQSVTKGNAENRFTVKQMTDVSKSYENLAKDPIYKQSREKLSIVKELKEMLSGDVEGREAFIIRTLLRMSGEQRFTEADVRQMSGSRAVKEKAIQAWSNISKGKITKRNIDIFLNALSVLESTNTENLRGTIKSRILDLKETSNLTEKQIEELVNEKVKREMESLGGAGNALDKKINDILDSVGA